MTTEPAGRGRIWQELDAGSISQLRAAELLGVPLEELDRLRRYDEAGHSSHPLSAVIGVDPGYGGAIAVVQYGQGGKPQIAAMCDLPSKLVTSEYFARIDEVQETIQDVLAGAGVDKADAVAYVESPIQSTFRSRSTKTLFQQGYVYGIVCCALSGVCGRIAPVTPAGWKRAMGLLGGVKDASIPAALAHFPEASALLGRKRDHHRAEALLIAAYGIKQELPSRCEQTRLEYDDQEVV